MCRVLSYLGSPVWLSDMLYEPDSSLIKQTYAPKMLGTLNLAGFGMTAWDDVSHHPERPFVYKTTDLPIFDRNLRALAQKTRPHAFLAHVRGVPYSDRVDIGPQNLHPFLYEDARIALAHNGDLGRFSEMRFELLGSIKPEIARRVSGSTDSEWVYALLLSQLRDPTEAQSASAIVDAVAETLRVLRKVRVECGIRQASSMNLFVADGRTLVATRFTFDFGRSEGRILPNQLDYLSLWYTTGRSYGHHDGEWKMLGGEADSIIVASEPLTADVSTWIEAPEYSMLVVSIDEVEKVQTIPLEI